MQIGGIAKRIAVIGAGVSGLTAIKCCRDEGLNVVCFEKSDRLGGLWNYREEDVEGISSVMRSTIINSSKEMSAFSDFPPPKEFPNYMHNTMMLRYLELYSEHFRLEQYIKYNHEVLLAEPAQNYDETGQWLLTVKNNDKNTTFSEIFDGVMVCSGHHVHPMMPTFPGQDTFKGQIIHTHSYKKPEGFEQKNIVVVGIGNSGGDAAVELSHVAKQVYLSTRRGSWVIHRVGDNGEPFDTQLIRRNFNCLFHVIPYSLTCSIAEKKLNERFDHEAYKLKPKHRIFGQHVMVNDALPNRILSGTVVIKDDILRFTPHGVVFKGEPDVEYPVDVVIMATGYKIGFPFISENICSLRENHVELYRFVFPPRMKHPTIAFIGLVQPIGALFPISEMQSRWFAALMVKRVKLPSQETMLHDIKKTTREIAKRYAAAPRHTIQVDWIDYMDSMAVHIGVKPNMLKILIKDPKLFWACVFGPCVAYQYRLQGSHKWPGAKQAILTVKERIKGALNTRDVPASGF